MRGGEDVEMLPGRTSDRQHAVIRDYSLRRSPHRSIFWPDEAQQRNSARSKCARLTFGESLRLSKKEMVLRVVEAGFTQVELILYTSIRVVIQYRARKDSGHVPGSQETAY